MIARQFHLQREEDVSGVSGTGRVAEGVILPSGWCVVWWLSKLWTVTTYENIGVVEKLHGHDGKTKIVYEDAEDEHIAAGWLQHWRAFWPGFSEAVPKDSQTFKADLVSMIRQARTGSSTVLADIEAARKQVQGSQQP